MTTILTIFILFCIESYFDYHRENFIETPSLLKTNWRNTVCFCYEKLVSSFVEGSVNGLHPQSHSLGSGVRVHKATDVDIAGTACSSSH